MIVHWKSILKRKPSPLFPSLISGGKLGEQLRTFPIHSPVNTPYSSSFTVRKDYRFLLSLSLPLKVLKDSLFILSPSQARWSSGQAQSPSSSLTDLSPSPSLCLLRLHSLFILDLLLIFHCKLLHSLLPSPSFTRSHCFSPRRNSWSLKRNQKW